LLKSEYIVGFHLYFEDEDNVYIILELCANQTLNELVKRRKRITEMEAKYYLHQIALGIRDIHENKVIHRDLKLGNLFLTESGDFGLAARLSFDAERRKTMCGTPNYIAPEIPESKSVDMQTRGDEVDVWSLGIIACAFVVGRQPLETSDAKTTDQRIKSFCYGLPDQVPLSHCIKRFITKMLMRDPARRDPARRDPARRATIVLHQGRIPQDAAYCAGRLSTQLGVCAAV
jgi:polo-like kinase 1